MRPGIPGGRRLSIGLMPIGMAIVLGSPPAFAETPADQGMEIGPWRASALASGQAMIKAKGIKIDWRGEVPAQFVFAVSEGGKAEGTWKHQGQATQVISGRAGAGRSGAPPISASRVEARSAATTTCSGSPARASSAVT